MTARAAPLAGRADRHQGRHRGQRPAAQLRLEDPRQVHLALRRDGDREAEGGRGVVFGRLNMDEFAMGSSTENSAFGRSRAIRGTRTRIPGGSSGGSAAAVAADECIAALGSGHGRFDSPAGGACAAAWGSSRPTAGFRATGWWRLPRRWTRSAVSPRTRARCRV